VAGLKFLEDPDQAFVCSLSFFLFRISILGRLYHSLLLCGKGHEAKRLGHVLALWQSHGSQRVLETFKPYGFIC